MPFLYTREAKSRCVTEVQKGYEALMKAVATALVLIVGAAVVLWYGNTLNSWVLGGLIGGLAALLLSIPISLTLFSYLSRRHDEHLHVEEQEEISLARTVRPSEYYEAPLKVARETYDVEGYALLTGALDEIEESRHQRYPTNRNLPVPASPQPLERIQSQQLRKLPSTQRGAYPQYPQEATQTQGGRDAAASGRRITKQIKYPGFPGYGPNSSRSQHESAALRAARLEAAQRYDDDVDGLPTNVSRRPNLPRPSQHLPAQDGRVTGSYQISQAPQAPYHASPRRTIDSTPPQTGQRRALPPAHARNEYVDQYEDYEDQEEQYGYDQDQDNAPTTEHLRDVHRQTGPMRSSTQTNQSGHATRNPHLEDQRRNPDVMSGSLKNPLLRRPPYMYKDDPLRQQLAQQINGPIARRSSLYDMQQEEEDQ